MWQPGNQVGQSFNGHSYSHLGSHYQSYERLQPGADVSPHQAATQSFTARYYDTNGLDDNFPRPVGLNGEKLPPADQGSFTSVQLQSASNSFASVSPNGLGPDRGGHNRLSESPHRRSATGDCIQYCRDKWARLLVMATAIIVVSAAARTAITAVMTLISNDFGVFSELAWESWFPSFYVLVLLFVIVSVVSIAIAGLGVITGTKETKPLLRTLNTTSAVVAVIVLGLGLLAWLYVSRARPYVVRAANLFCQESDVWGCNLPMPTPAATLVPSTAVSTGVPLSPQSPPITPPTIRSLGEALPIGVGDTLTVKRRLNPARAAVSFRETLGAGKDASGVPYACDKIEKVCYTMPIGFQESTACVCSGLWDYSNGSSTGAFQTASAERSDPWQGSIGAYCGAWTPDISSDEWCFVSSAQQCAPSAQVLYKSSKGATLTRSTGPCSDAVESRSQYVINGMNKMLNVIWAGFFLGVSLIAVSLSGFTLYYWPSKFTRKQDQVARVPDYKAGHARKNSYDPIVLEQQFEDAQKEAVRKLNDQTPNEQKLMLYGFFKQGQEGDARGAQPSFWNAEERSKYDYWARHKGMSRREAIEGYIKTVAMVE